jgi:predicted RNA-binding protein Jag
MNELVTKEIHTLFSYLGFGEPELKQERDEEIGIDVISISTQDQEAFTENNNELLHAFNYLLKRLIEKRDNNTSFVIDFNGEQKKLIKEAKQKAHIAHQRVVQYNKAYEFGYLNGFERMIIHSYLKEKEDIHTSSFGKGKDRRLKVSKRS